VEFRGLADGSPWHSFIRLGLQPDEGISVVAKSPGLVKVSVRTDGLNGLDPIVAAPDDLAVALGAFVAEVRRLDWANDPAKGFDRFQARRTFFLEKDGKLPFGMVPEWTDLFLSPTRNAAVVRNDQILLAPDFDFFRLKVVECVLVPNDPSVTVADALRDGGPCPP